MGEWLTKLRLEIVNANIGEIVGITVFIILAGLTIFGRFPKINRDRI